MPWNLHVHTFLIYCTAADASENNAPERASRFCRSPESFAPGATYMITNDCTMSLCTTDTTVQVTTGDSNWFTWYDDLVYVTNNVDYTISVWKQTLCATGASGAVGGLGCRNTKKCTLDGLQLNTVAGGVCENRTSDERDGVATCPSDLGTASGSSSIQVASEHLTRIAKEIIVQQVCSAA